MLKQNENLKEKELVKIRENYQVTIPYNLRRLMKLKVGDYLEMSLENNYLAARLVKIVTVFNKKH
ncbi:MAG: AbrB/MazE/SpoVT family DNA-binding domain-containing protein [Candidatus Moraniibacteriota bacterium]